MVLEGNDGNDDDHAASSDSLRPPVNDSQSRVNSRAPSAKVCLLYRLCIPQPAVWLGGVWYVVCVDVRVCVRF